ncbi:HlyD family efflux transporter periplasmic adaptor subunit [Limnohabitans radicicola]|uniref:HlyD family efflux transporter periplasmic adaptor subunit n=1 Tax=Limnohabitans radicicola TaxID=2771427 RepID=A0A927FJ70_9BURK|nr:HlyD family efflux transporter periplasmic adaptor subunit [Limnohabitans radicicola]MBD8051746.1 HlyD family efflux transporter periplasmic adaptor subunit [Limnohabitans radicicola]
MTTHRTQRAGAGLLLLVTLLAFVTWAALFDIDQIVRASGQVIPQERTQLIQVADGGVLQELRVSEGEQVHKGQTLAVLEGERASAGVDEVRNRIAGLDIARLRAQAEASGPTDLSIQAFPVGAYQRSHLDLVQAQQALYRQNIQTLHEELRAQSQQIQLAEEERQLTERLHQSGDISLVELMRTQRAVLELQQRRQATQDKFRSEARKELARIEDEITSQRSKLQERQSVFDHTVLQAPTDGIVKYLRINTLGGVLRPGDELMQISPTEGQYLVEAKVNPADIGQLALGQKATLRFDAFDYSLYGTVPARLDYLSSDTLSEPGPDGRSSQTYYRARLTMTVLPGHKIRPQDIKPGMTVTVDIQTGQRSILHYIAKPITRAFSGALGQK